MGKWNWQTFRFIHGSVEIDSILGQFVPEAAFLRFGIRYTWVFDPIRRCAANLADMSWLETSRVSLSYKDYKELQDAQDELRRIKGKRVLTDSEILAAVSANGSQRKAAAALGINPHTGTPFAGMSREPIAPRLLVVDIETRPLLAYVGMFQQNIGPHRLSVGRRPVFRREVGRRRRHDVLRRGERGGKGTHGAPLRIACWMKRTRLWAGIASGSIRAGS